MAAFLSPLVIEKIAPTRWRLDQDLVFLSDEYHGQFVVPRGFETDFASVPRWLWGVVAKVGAHDRAAVLHDAAYEHALVTVRGRRVHATKAVADRLFAEALRADGVGVATRVVMTAAVRAFGDPVRRRT